jgi:hypothetical protein
MAANPPPRCPQCGGPSKWDDPHGTKGVVSSRCPACQRQFVQFHDPPLRMTTLRPPLVDHTAGWPNFKGLPPEAPERLLARVDLAMEAHEAFCRDPNWVSRGAWLGLIDIMDNIIHGLAHDHSRSAAEVRQLERYFPRDHAIWTYFPFVRAAYNKKGKKIDWDAARAAARAGRPKP